GEVWEPTGFGECVQAALCLTPGLGSRLLGHVAFSEFRPRFRHVEHRRVEDGMPALIKLDALPGRLLHGHVQRVGNVAVQESHWVDFRVYHTWVSIDETVDGLRPDMTAEVTIVDGAEKEPVLAVPLQSILHSPSDGNHGTCYVLTDDGPRPREVIV